MADPRRQRSCMAQCLVRGEARGALAEEEGPPAAPGWLIRPVGLGRAAVGAAIAVVTSTAGARLRPPPSPRQPPSSRHRRGRHDRSDHRGGRGCRRHLHTTVAAATVTAGNDLCPQLVTVAAATIAATTLADVTAATTFTHLSRPPPSPPAMIIAATTTAATAISTTTPLSPPIATIAPPAWRPQLPTPPRHRHSRRHCRGHRRRGYHGGCRHIQQESIAAALLRFLGGIAMAPPLPNDVPSVNREAREMSHGSADEFRAAMLASQLSLRRRKHFFALSGAVERRRRRGGCLPGRGANRPRGLDAGFHSIRPDSFGSGGQPPLYSALPKVFAHPCI